MRRDPGCSASAAPSHASDLNLPWRTRSPEGVSQVRARAATRSTAFEITTSARCSRCVTQDFRARPDCNRKRRGADGREGHECETMTCGYERSWERSVSLKSAVFARARASAPQGGVIARRVHATMFSSILEKRFMFSSTTYTRCGVRTTLSRCGLCDRSLPARSQKNRSPRCDPRS